MNQNIKKTIRLVYPQWQGGVNPDYVFGSKLLAFLAPPNPDDETIEIAVNQDFNEALNQIDGIDGGDALLEQMNEATRVLKEKEPDHVIVFGGDCAVSQRPFDYLHGKYGKKLGIIWLDAHPDLSTTQDSSHLHEMVLGNLMGLSQKSELTRVEYPFDKKKVIYAGLIEEVLRPMDRRVKDLNLTIAGPEALEKDSWSILNWIKENDVKYAAVHFDLDALSPGDFRSIYPGEPYCGQFPAAVGRLTLNQVERILKDVSLEAEIVGMTIAEHLPWDAFRLRKTLSNISIFMG